MQHSREIAGAAPGIQNIQAAHVAQEPPQDGIRIQEAIAIPLRPDLDLPVAGNAVPEIPRFSELLIIHRRTRRAWATLTNHEGTKARRHEGTKRRKTAHVSFL